MQPLRASTPITSSSFNSDYSVISSLIRPDISLLSQSVSDEICNVGGGIALIDVHSGTVGVSSDAVGVSSGAVGVSSGAVGVSSDAVGVSSGTVGVSSDAVDVSSGAVGVSSGEWGDELGDAVGVSSGAVGVSSDAVDVFSGAVGVSSDPVGVSSGAVGVSSGAVGVSSGAVGVSSGAVGVFSDAVDVSSGAVGVSSGAVGVSSDAVGVSSGAVDVLSGAVDVSSGVGGDNALVDVSSDATRVEESGITKWSGFKLVGDNIDKTIKPRDMRLNKQATSLHYFNVYAVKDRIDFSHLSKDDNGLIHNFETLVTRILVQHVPGLQLISSKVNCHIEHKYSKQMSQKSKVIPLGVLLKNENVIDDMVHILDALHKYVPTTTSNKTVQICEESEAIRALDIDIHHFRHILLGGDQLTVARIRVYFYCQVVWKRLYSTCSGIDGGTLFQLRNLINRRNVVKDVKKDLNSCEEFMELITKAHILSAAMTVAEVQDLQGLSRVILSSEDHLTTLTSSTKSTDRVQEYAMETLSLGLLLLEFKDAVREGDGTRVIRCWKYFLIIFRVTGHKNYCLEALHLLTQYYFTLPPQYAEQMVWGRFVNSNGGQGNNISADLHMEHLNRLLKDAISLLGANKTPQAILRTSKALGVVKDILCQFDGTTGVCFTGKHTRRSDDEDLTKVLDELSQCQTVCDLKSPLFQNSNALAGRQFRPALPHS
ncbi:hypothetical protein EMCRGX_G027343 [Ephydatia muelleri]